jgi:uncharacterized membrane protein YraQ (UPF0718 family)/copper chaperone CopZ
MEYITDFIGELFYILAEMAPYLLLGFFFAGLLHLLFPKKRVRKYLGKNNFTSVVNASLLGIPLPLCSCGVIPTGISFYKHGASKASTVSFLISTPQTGIDSIFVTYSLLGLPFALIRPVVAFITGLFGGAITQRVDKDNVASQVSKGEEENEIPAGFIPKIREMFRYSFVEFLQDISNWLIIGLLAAALISVIVPDNFFETMIPNSFVGMLMILVVAIPVYICATASVPIAAVLMLKGLSPGAALVLLMAGPATNAATITMIGKVMGKKSLMAYLGAIITGALLAGLVIDNFLPREWFSLSEHFGHIGHEHHGILPGWLKTGSAILLSIFILNGYLRKHLFNKKEIGNKPSVVSGNGNIKNITTLYVGGMTCNHCRQNVENSVRSSEGVKDVYVDLATGKVEFTGDSPDIQKIRDGIESIGYKIIKEGS